MILKLVPLTLFFMAVECMHEISNSIFRCPLRCMCLSQSQVMCNNGDLTNIPVGELSPLIEHLTLSKNNISVIKSEAFVEFKHLRILCLDGNNISRIGRFAFKGLGKLRELSVQNTLISRLEKFSFSGLQNLTAILLSHNRITTIEEFTFAGTSNVRLILLTHNPLHIVEARAFANLRNVEHLIFPSGIRGIEPDAFNGLDAVGLIKLPFMDLASMEAFTFRGLTHVHVLAIQDSDLGVVKPQVFGGLMNVGSLNIINNKIDHLQELTISPENRVKVLRLLGNHLLQTPTYDAVQVTVLENFTVVSNHFPCDCRIHSILEGPLANGTSYSFILKNYCISPLELNGRTISEMGFERISRCANEYNLQGLDSATHHHVLSTHKLYIMCLLSLILVAWC